MHPLLALLVLTAPLPAGTTGPSATPATASAAPVTSATPALDEARQLGWEFAELIVDVIARDTHASPGLAAFVEDFRREQDARRAAMAAGRTHVIDIDALVTRNPTFWRASYEVAPADPAWLMLHASLLLSAGEACRSQQIAALAHLPGRAPAPYDSALASIMGQAQGVIAESSVIVDQGVAAFDAGRRDEAMRAYEKALAAWPQNARAHHEIGLCHLMDAVEKPATRKERAKQKREVAAALAAGESPFHRKAAAEAFARARQHDPLSWMAYQGTGDIVAQAKAMLGRVLPAWEKLNASSFAKLDDADLLNFAEGLQQGQADELALVARQLIVLRRGRFAPEDHPFIATSLRRLAPGAATEAALSRLASEQLTVISLAGSWKGETP